MKETGIIMSGSHPRDILDGTKTMTRRTWGLERINRNPDDWVCVGHDKDMWFFRRTTVVEDSIILKCPYGQVGDRLIIKETWATENQYNHLKPSEVPRTAKIWYLADEHYDPQIMGKVRSAMFMCNWMSRAKPEITGLRAERLQKITEEDAKAEGVDCCPNQAYTDYRHHFMVLWDSLNAKRGYPWEANHWVWPITFKEVKQ